MNFRRLAASIALAFFLCAEAEASEVTTGSCYTVWVSAPHPSGKSKPVRRSLSFSAREVLDLEFLVALPSQGSADGKKIVLKLYTPRGHLYQTLSIPPAETDATPSQRRRRFRTVIATLPVAGTTIVNNSLYGAWKAEAYVEGETSPCARPRQFEIQP